MRLSNLHAYDFEQPNKQKMILLQLISIFGIFGLSAASDRSAADLVIDTRKGQLKGVAVTGESEQSGCTAYLGIPYAQPPVGDLRFREPVMHEGWDGVRDATTVREACLNSPTLMDNPIPKSEDCLFVDIVLPPNHDIKGTNKKAVMVYIHGGGFIVGSGASGQPPESQCRGFGQEDVIVVMVQYRLGIFGFLSFGDDGVAPGNYGVHDQVMALRWIHENIAAFGGDPDRVTIFGTSAGGASASILSLLPAAQPYFSGAIAISGSIYGYWVINEEPVRRSFQLRDAFNCNTGRGASADLDCLRTKPAEELTAKLSVLHGPQSMYVPKKDGAEEGVGGGISALESMTFHFNPRIDNRLIFDPKEMIRKNGGKTKPFITGTTGAETMFFLSPKMPFSKFMISNSSVNFWVDDDVTDKTFDQTLKESAIEWSKVTNSEMIQDVVKKGRELYLNRFGYEPGNKELMSTQFFRLTSDVWADAPAILDAEIRKAGGGKVWMFNLNRSPVPLLAPINVHGSHGDDILYIFVDLMGIKIAEDDAAGQRIRRTLIGTFSRFAKTGRPTTTDKDAESWPQYESLDRPLNLRMTEANDYVDDQFHNPTVPFWVASALGPGAGSDLVPPHEDL